MEQFRWEFAIRLTISKADRDQVTPRLTSKQTWRLSPSIFTESGLTRYSSPIFTTSGQRASTTSRSASEHGFFKVTGLGHKVRLLQQRNRSSSIPARLYIS